MYYLLGYLRQYLDKTQLFENMKSKGFADSEGSNIVKIAFKIAHY